VEMRPPAFTSPQEPNIHHRTPEAVARDCKSCHGSMVANFDDGHYVPTYDPSLVTPWPAGKPNGGPSGEGNCNFCHDAGLPDILDNHDTHHDTGLTRASFTGLTSACCACHPPLNSNPASCRPNFDAFDMRKCEQCHGVQTLHNIQADSNGNGISVGLEDAYYGHIGNNLDCWGCHGFTAIAADVAPYAGPVVPHIQSTDVGLVTAGTSAWVTVTGAALSNIMDTPAGPMKLDSAPVLTAPDGTTISLAAQSVTESTMVVDVPGTLTAGKYSLRAVKGPQTSNPAVLSVVPAVVVTDASCNGDAVVTVNGSGFSDYVNATNSGTSVSSGTEIGTVLSWNDTEIVAQFASCPGTVEVRSVFGTAIADVAGGPAKTWAPSSIIDVKNQSTSDIANYVFLLVLPIGALILWKSRGRKK